MEGTKYKIQERYIRDMAKNKNVSRMRVDLYNVHPAA